MAFTEKSGQFLDTFWELARDRHSYRWLVHNQDLHNLEKAMQEHDPSIRLRVLSGCRTLWFVSRPIGITLPVRSRPWGGWRARRKDTSGSSKSARDTSAKTNGGAD